MADASWREAVQSSRAQPGDGTLLERAVSLCHRAQAPVPADLLDRRVLPPTELSTTIPLRVRAELPGGRFVELGETPGTVALPERRTWWVQPRPMKLTAAIEAELQAHEVPGLSFERSRKCAQLLPRLTELPHLSWLSLRSTGAGDDVLAALPAHSRLAELNLGGCRRLTAKGAQCLTRLPSLVRLTLDHCAKIRDYGFFGDLPLLRRLSMIGILFTNTALRTLPELPGLTHLNLLDSYVRPSAQDVLLRLPGLRELTYRGPLEDLTLGILAQLPELRALLFPMGFETPVDLRPLAKLRNLRMLSVDLRAGPSGLDELSGLTHLRLNGCTGPVLRAAANLPKLEFLSLFGGATNVGEEDVAALARNPSLKLVQFNCSLITTESMLRLQERVDGLTVRLGRSLPERTRDVLLSEFPADPLLAVSWHRGEAEASPAGAFSRAETLPDARNGTPWLQL